MSSQSAAAVNSGSELAAQKAMKDNAMSPPTYQQTQAIPRKPVANAPQHEKQARQTYSRSSPTWWNRWSRRARIIALVVIIAVLALIIRLAAGLSQRSKSQQDLPLPSSNGGPYEGDLTYYAPGLGACGVTSANGEKIVAVSHYIFDKVQVGSDPNTNPLCGKQVRVKTMGGDVSVDLTVVDRCVGCQPTDLDLTEDTFATLANVDLGRVKGEWSWLDSVPGSSGDTP